MGLSRVVVFAALVGCVVCTSIPSHPENSLLYPRQRRGSDQRLAELEALLTLTKFIKEKQAQDMMFENIGKRRKRQQQASVDASMDPNVDEDYAGPAVLPLMAVGWNVPADPEALRVPMTEDAPRMDNPHRYPWNRFKSQDGNANAQQKIAVDEERGQK